MPAIDFSNERAKRRPHSKFFQWILRTCAVITVVVLGSTFASNINLNGGGSVEFGQGVAQATACDSDILVTPFSTFANASGAGGFIFSSVNLSNINSDVSHCEGKSFLIKAYGASNTPLTLYGESSSLVVCDQGSSFSSFSASDYSVASSDGTSFTASITSPVASAQDVQRLTIQSSNLICSLSSQTFDQNVSVPSGNGTELQINNALSSNKLSATGFTGRVRAVVSVDCGDVHITTTTGISGVYGYQDPVTSSGASIAFEGTVSDVNSALNTLTYNRETCAGTQHLTGSIIQASADPSSPISYNPSNGHFYQYIDNPISWDGAFNTITGSNLQGTDGTFAGILGSYNPNRSYASCHYKFNGMCGYMATVTSEAEDIFIGNKVGSHDIWLGGSDRRNPGTWVWEDDRAPEFGTVISTLGTTGDDPTKISGSYANWAGGEPNSYGGDETFIHSGETAIQTYASSFGVPPSWNNLPETGLTLGYLVEYGGSSIDTGVGDQPQTHNITLNLQ
jgi:hypothetical protein